jgi:hypothetical protein
LGISKSVLIPLLYPITSNLKKKLETRKQKKLKVFEVYSWKFLSDLTLISFYIWFLYDIKLLIYDISLLISAKKIAKFTLYGVSKQSFTLI